MHIYDLTVAQFIRILGQIPAWLDKAEAHAVQKKFDPNVLMHARLAPDQFSFGRQIQAISDQAKGGAARLAGITPPVFPDEEKTIADLRERVNKTVEFLKTLKREQYDGAEDRTIALPWMPGKGIKGGDFAVGLTLPNFYFHATTAYAILRHNGVDLGKMDFLGAPTKLLDL